MLDMSTVRPSATTTMTTSASTSDLAPDSTPPTSQAPFKTPSQRKQLRRRRIHRPAKNSLYDLIHQHAGTSLFVRPICWTDLHSEVLDTRWTELPPCDTPKPAAVPGSPPSRGHMRPSQTIITLCDSLTQILLPETVHPIISSNAARTLLMTLWPGSFGKAHYLPELHLFFGGRVYRDAVRTQLMWNFPSSETKSSYSSFMSVSTRAADSFTPSTQPCSPPQTSANLPMMCYIGKNQLASIRRSLFRVASAPDRTSNDPVYRLQQLRAKQLVPSNSDHDAHFVGIFLAMAQKHFYATPEPSLRRDSPITPGKAIPPCPNFQDVTLRILTHDNKTAEFIVYTGFVTARFLRQFHDPYKAPKGGDGEMEGIKISYTKVPIWPILGLRERLGKALGQDIVGPFDEEEMETWDSDVEEEKDESSKRKREPLSEVLNRSFDEDTDEEPALSSKKRCLGDGAPVGIVM
ncbi:hypothetical protein G7046_g2542 [Stylonectria norvegica]|nr:hypothetical protein G7046_g2542 [Stylonectria norvegica]